MRPSTSTPSTLEVNKLHISHAVTTHNQPSSVGGQNTQCRWVICSRTLCPPGCRPHGYKCPYTHRISWLYDPVSIKVPNDDGYRDVGSILAYIRYQSISTSSVYGTMAENNHMYASRYLLHVGSFWGLYFPVATKCLDNHGTAGRSEQHWLHGIIRQYSMSV